MTGNAPELLLDTSAAVPLVIADHEAHADVLEAVGDARLGLAGHALFETYSVLTRLPPPLRRAPAEVARLLDRNFPVSCFLTPADAQPALTRFAALGIAGGSVYDGLVAMAAVRHRITLVTRDRRALDTYRALGVELLDLTG